MVERRVVVLLVAVLLAAGGMSSCAVLEKPAEVFGVGAHHPSDYTDRAVELIKGKAFDDRYRIGPGDSLIVTAWGKAELAASMMVLPDGKVSYPLVGDIRAEGLTPEELAAMIEQAISQYDRDAQISVSVREIRSLEYSVLGETPGQGVYPLTRRTTLLKAIAKAEGFGEFTDRTNVILIRRVDGKEMRFRFDFDDFVSNSNSRSVNLEIQPGDVILFP